jgi:hypothetical protein
MIQEQVQLHYLFVLLVDSLGQLLLQKQDDFFDILTRHHVHSYAQSLSADVQIWAGQDAQNLHGQVIKNALVCLAQLVDLFKDNQFDIVVRLFDAQINKFGSSCLDCDGVIGEGCE